MANRAWVGASVTAKSMLMPYEYKARRIVVHQGFDKHDVYRLFTKGIDKATANPAFQSGAPLLINVSSQGTQQYLYAYVVKVVQHEQGKLPPVYELVCVGATNPLKNSAKGTFLRRNVTSVAQEQCSKYGLACVGQLDNTVWSDLSPVAGESEWQHLVRIVRQAGGALCAYGAAVRIADLAQPWVSSPPPAILTQGTMDVHVATVGIAGSVEAALYDADFNGSTVKQPAPAPILGSGKPGTTRLPERSIPDTFPSLGETMSALRAASVLSAYTHVAKMRVVGQLKLQCGMIVRLNLTDTSQTEYAGLWLVSEVKHEITNATGEYVTDMTLIKDSFGEPTLGNTQRASAALAGIPRVQTAWRNNQWTALGRVA